MNLRLSNRLLAAVFILLAAIGSLYARGAKENSVLSQADELIANKEYDEAVHLLSEYMKTNPDNFGESQKRLQKILKLREEYNLIANELLDTLETDPENNDKILELSDLLLTIESPANPATRRFLDNIRYVAEFNVNRKRLQQILLAGGEQLNANDYSGALATYSSGFNIYQNHYFTAGYGEEAENTARNGLRDISDTIRQFNSLSGPFSLSVRNITGSPGRLDKNPSELGENFGRLAPQMEELGNLYTGLVNIENAFTDQLLILQRDYNIAGDTCFLSFMIWLLEGPSGHTEGIKGTLERFLHDQVGLADTVVSDYVNRSYNMGYTAMVNREYAAGLTAFDETSKYIDTAKMLLGSWNAFLTAKGSPGYSIYGERVREEKIGDFLKYRSMEKAIDYLRDLGETGSRGSIAESGPTALDSWKQGIITFPAAVSLEKGVREFYQGLTNELSGYDEKIGAEIEELRSYLTGFDNINAGIGTPQSYLSDARNLAISLSSRLRTMEYNAAIRQYTIANGDLENRVNSREKEFIDGNSLIEGISQVREGVGVYIALYPAEGSAMLNQMNENLTMDITAANELLAQYQEENNGILGLPEIRTLRGAAQDMYNRLLGLRGRVVTITASARTQVERAASLRYEGDRLFQSAQAALSRNDFDNAKNTLTRATDQYNASLAVQESASLRELWDTQLIRLGADIVRIENEVVVRDVRNLLNAARTQYYSGSIEEAEATLVRAQNRWQVTNITDQPEIVYWLSLVRGALSIQSGRNISPTAPLYAEMSQLLSDANRSYNEGVRLLNSNRRSEGLVLFNDALAKTREIRLMFPLNHDARLLELRIEQQIDLPAFNASFRQKLNEAVAGTKDKNTQAYADLQDLAEINPRYAGIQNLLSQAEIDMGFRPPPPNPGDLTRSTELTNNARAVINARDSIRYEVAEAWLNDAIRLNPNNTQAQTLIDQLQMLITGTGTIIMDSYSMERYNTALQEFLRGNYLSANAIVLQLLQNPDNQRSSMVQELKRRIESVL